VSLKSDIFADYAAMSDGRPANCLRVLRKCLTSPGLRVVVLYRLGRAAYLRGHLVLALWLQWKMIRLGADISTEARIGPGLRVPHPQGITVGSKTLIGERAYLLQGVTLGGSLGKARPDGSTQPRVGDNVCLGAGAKLVGPVDIGDNVMIGANAVVTCDLPADCVAAGVPARIIRQKGQAVPSAFEELKSRFEVVLTELDKLKNG